VEKDKKEKKKSQDFTNNLVNEVNDLVNVKLEHDNLYDAIKLENTDLQK